MAIGSLLNLFNSITLCVITHLTAELGQARLLILLTGRHWIDKFIETCLIITFERGILNGRIIHRHHIPKANGRQGDECFFIYVYILTEFDLTKTHKSRSTPVLTSARL